MISRYHLQCPGCSDKFVARVGAEPTTFTKLYLPCPRCHLPIRARVSGQELSQHRIDFDCAVVQEKELPPDPLVVTINPFVPSRYDADSFSGLGAFPTMTLLEVLGDQKYLLFHEERGAAAGVIEELWPDVRIAFEYYLSQNWQMFESIAYSKFELADVGKTVHERTTLAYQVLGTVTTNIVGGSGSRSARLYERFGRKHVAAFKHEQYRSVVRTRGLESQQLERDMFRAIEHFISEYEAWEMGRLVRHIDESPNVLEDLVLYRDEFPLVRELYQLGFEMACKCLWVLVAAQNGAKRKDADAFGDEHPASVPERSRVNTLKQFDKLSNAHKIAYVAQVPGWECLKTFLNNQRRNTIGHATTTHDLKTGRIVSDKNPEGITYLDFLGETFGVFETLTVLMQVLRAARIAASPDFS